MRQPRSPRGDPATETANLRISSSIPDAPPPEVLAEVDAAWRRSAGFGGDDLSLHVRLGRISGRVSGDLRCEDAIVTRLSATQILAVACGDPLPLPRSPR